MNESKTKHRRILNVEQLEVLELLYKFRFGSRSLIARYFGKKDGAFVHKRLQILVELGYIGKRFDSSYRIKGKPATYYLLPAGARILQESRDPDDTDTVNVRRLYNDGSRSEAFVAHCMKLFGLYNQLEDHYGDDLNFLTRRDLAGLDHFPDLLSDAFVSLTRENRTYNFFMEVLDDDRRFFLPDKKIRQYLLYKQSGQWAETQTPFPSVLLICRSTSMLKRAQEKIAVRTHTALDDNVGFIVTSDKLTDMVHELDTAVEQATAV